jgi:hypothetical protein
MATRTPKAIPKVILDKIKIARTLRLDLGCGPNKQPGTFGIDTRSLAGVDLVWDLEEMPWPLPDDLARVVFMTHFWEHISPKKTLPFMAELHRVCQHDAQVLISAPYGTEFRFVQDPTHCNPTNEATFAYWDNLHESGLWHVYQPKVLHLESFEIFPAGRSRDFSAILRVCKAGHNGQSCQHSIPSLYDGAEPPKAKAKKRKTR